MKNRNIDEKIKTEILMKNQKSKLWCKIKNRNFVHKIITKMLVIYRNFSLWLKIFPKLCKRKYQCFGKSLIKIFPLTKSISNSSLFLKFSKTKFLKHFNIFSAIKGLNWLNLKSGKSGVRNHSSLSKPNFCCFKIKNFYENSS